MLFIRARRASSTAAHTAKRPRVSRPSPPCAGTLTEVSTRAARWRSQSGVSSEQTGHGITTQWSVVKSVIWLFWSRVMVQR